MVEGAAVLGVEVIDRCNLTVLLEPGQEDLVDFLALHKVCTPQRCVPIPFLPFVLSVLLVRGCASWHLYWDVTSRLYTPASMPLT